MSGQPQVASHKPRVDIETRIYRLLGQWDDPYTRPPLDHRKMYMEDIVVCLNNEGHEVWIGDRYKWDFFIANSGFRKICFWYLSQWAFVDWFGLRSFIWFKLLNRQCARNHISE